MYLAVLFQAMVFFPDIEGLQANLYMQSAELLYKHEISFSK